MTETSPVVCVNHVENNLPSTVGPPLRRHTGAHRRAERAAGEGAVQHAGLLEQSRGHRRDDRPGRLAEHRRYREHQRAAATSTITGRLKEIIVMSNGEKVPPADMEEAILRDRLFDQVMVYGEGHPYAGGAGGGQSRAMAGLCAAGRRARRHAGIAARHAHRATGAAAHRRADQGISRAMPRCTACCC